MNNGDLALSGSERRPQQIATEELHRRVGNCRPTQFKGRPPRESVLLRSKTLLPPSRLALGGHHFHSCQQVGVRLHYFTDYLTTPQTFNTSPIGV